MRRVVVEVSHLVGIGDVIHVADMLKALPARRGDPETVAWLRRPDLAASISSYQKAIR
jgi:hypothetical protein